MSIEATPSSDSYLNEVSTASKTILQSDVEEFCRLSGDYNPIHHSEEYAAETRFEKPIIHGALLTSLVSAALAQLPGAVVLVSQRMKFEKPAYPGSTFTASAVVDGELRNGMYAVRTAVTDELQTVYATGDAVVLVDSVRPTEPETETANAE